MAALTELTNDQAKALVLDYLARMEARDVKGATAMLGDGFTMTFPGTAPMTALTELIDWAKGRYRFVTKTNEATEVFRQGDTTVVYVRGTLAGEWPDGRVFDGVRFIDRFAIRNGRIVQQDVWNDLAEVKGR